MRGEDQADRREMSESAFRTMMHSTAGSGTKRHLRRGPPGMVAMRMGMLDGRVSAKIEVGLSVRGVADFVEPHRGLRKDLYTIWEDQLLIWPRSSAFEHL